MLPETLTRPAGAAKRRHRVVEYPDGDGKPMAETNPHVSLIIYVRRILRYWFRAVVENVCVYELEKLRGKSGTNA